MGVRRSDRVGGTATILVTDLVGSTAMFDRLGDEKAERLLREHLGDLRNLVRSFGGVEVKSTGDGIMAAFPAAWLATECAVAMQRSLHLRNEEASNHPLHVRIGLHSGDTTADRHDYYGIAVAVAARLCDQAPSDGILVSGVTRGLVGSRGGHTFTHAGTPALKGIDEPVDAWALEWGPGQLPPATPPGLEPKRGQIVAAASATALLALGGVFVMARSDEPPPPAPPPEAGGAVVRVSVRNTGDETTGKSYAAEIAGNASHVVFESVATDLVGRDGNGSAPDVFHVALDDGTVRPRTLQLVSRSGSEQGDRGSTQPSVSHDGGVVGFLSSATNLAAKADRNEVQDVFMRLMTEGTTSRVSISTKGVVANAGSFEVDVSGDGNYIAFTTAATNLSFKEDTNRANDIFVRDVALGKTNRVNIATTLTEANLHSSDPGISAEGDYVAFASPADTLSRDDTNNSSDVFRYNRALHKTVRASLAYAAERTNATGSSSQPSISDDGTRIAFVSEAENLAEGDTTSDPDVFVYDFREKRTVVVTPDVTPGDPQENETANPVISGDGRWVAFDSTAPNLVEGDTNGVRDVFLYDLETTEIVRLSVDEDGDEVFEPSADPSISVDGRFVTFTSAASLVAVDTNEVLDVYVRGPLHD